jgi:hypothetical protein
MRALAAVVLLPLPALSIVHRIRPTTSTFVAPIARRSVDRPSSSFRRCFRRRTPSVVVAPGDSDPDPDVDVPVASRDDDRDVDDQDDARDPSSWANRAILFSSFDDGISNNDDARSFLRHSLIHAMLRERIDVIENQIRNTAMFSPCNGPRTDVIDELECVDGLIERGRSILVDGMSSSSPSSSLSSSSLRDDGDIDSWSNEVLRILLLTMPHPPRARVLYVPTAMYALDPRSTSTPGKQRQRARADGRKRRDKLVDLVGDLLTLDDDDDDDIGIDGDLRRMPVLSSTLDLCDGSLKHHIGSNDASLFPTTDVEALTSWRPHLVYVEGGNTFWLRHCMDEGYASALRDACCDGGYAVYCGKSAGAIVAGMRVDTATWKGWDDPSVVPDMGGYDDWSDVRGLDLVGGRSLFPHMSDDWSDTVNERRAAMATSTSAPRRRRMDDGPGYNDLVCLREHDALCVVGDERLLLVTSGTGSLN